MQNYAPGIDSAVSRVRVTKNNNALTEKGKKKDKEKIYIVLDVVLRNERLGIRNKCTFKKIGFMVPFVTIHYCAFV